MERKVFICFICCFVVLSVALSVRAEEPYPRPIPLGISGGNILDSSRRYCCSGTLGALVQDINGTQYILSNNHVLARTNLGVIGEDILQPGLVDQNPACYRDPVDAVADLSKFIPISFKYGVLNKVDAAIAQVREGQVDLTGVILNIGPISAETVAAIPGMAVQKNGRTTDLTKGIVSAVSATIKVVYNKTCGTGSQIAAYTNQILIGPAGFSAGGDSGSLIVEDILDHPRAIGLLFAGSSTITAANPIDAVLSALGVTMVGGGEQFAMASSLDSNEIVRIKERHEKFILNQEGVVGVGVGISGIKVFAKNRKRVRQIIPEKLENIPVEIVETDEIIAFSGDAAGWTASSDLCQPLAVASYSTGQEYSPPADQLRGLAQTLFTGMLGVIGQSLTKGIDAQIMLFSFSTIPVIVPAAAPVPIKMFSDPVPGAEIYIEQEPSGKKAQEQGGPYAQSFSNLDDPRQPGRPVDYGIMEEGIKSAAAIPGGSVLTNALSSREGGVAVVGLGETEQPVKSKPEQIEPVWDAPMEDIHFILIPPTTGKSGVAINGLVTLHDIAWLKDERLADLAPFFIVIKSENPEVALFPGHKVLLEHIIDTVLIKDDGTYNFSFTMESCGMGKINLKFSWSWPIGTEGACSVAILGVYAGCKIGGQLNPACVCATLADMPFPGSWACSAHPQTFRIVWGEWGCAGICPY